MKSFARLLRFLTDLAWVVGIGCYVWGAKGQLLIDLTEADIRRMESRNDGGRHADDAVAMWEKRKNIEGARAFDCSGLITYLWEVCGALGAGLRFQKNADALQDEFCKTIKKSELLPGDLVFKANSKNRAYHVGVYMGKNMVIESAGRTLGVVERPMSAQNWNKFGRPKALEAEILANGGRVPDPDVPTRPFEVDRLLKYMPKLMRGTDVQQVQQALITKGFSVGEHGADAAYGNDTYKAVIEFQKKQGLNADGIVGRRTTEALGGTWEG